jgi:hypothetical protein
VGVVERSIRTIKERNRSTVHGLPFIHLPGLMITAIVMYSVMCLNQLPAVYGILDTLSPLTIMTSKTKPNFNKIDI